MTTEPASPGPDTVSWTRSRVLRRCPHDRMLAGVASGAADYLGLDPTLIRVGLVILTLFGIGVPLYLAAWLLIPEEDAERSIAEELLDWYRSR